MRAVRNMRVVAFMVTVKLVERSEKIRVGTEIVVIFRLQNTKVETA